MRKCFFEQLKKRIIHIFTFDFDGSGKLRGPETEVGVSVWALAPGWGGVVKPVGALKVEFKMTWEPEPGSCDTFC